MSEKGFVYEAMGEEVLTVDDTSGGVGFAMTGMGKKPPDKMVGQVQAEQISFRVRGTTSPPTSTVGKIANPTDIITLTGADIATFRAIRTGSSSGKIDAEFFKRVAVPL